MLNAKRILLRPVEPYDLELLYRWENDPALSAYKDEAHFLSKDQLQQYILSAAYSLQEAGQLRLMIALPSGETIGCIDLFAYNAKHARAGVGVLIDEAFRGSGYAKEALQCLRDYAFQTLHLRQLYCDIAESNVISQQLFEGCGFSRAGEKKAWLCTGPKQFESAFLYQCLNPYL